MPIFKTTDLPYLCNVDKEQTSPSKQLKTKQFIKISSKKQINKHCLSKRKKQSLYGSNSLPYYIRTSEVPPRNLNPQMKQVLTLLSTPILNNDSFSKEKNYKETKNQIIIIKKYQL